MLDRFLIALGLIGLSVLVYWVVNRLQRSRATAAARAEIPAGDEGQAAPLRGPRILYFRSDSCTSCATQARLLDELDADTRSRIEPIDVDREKDRAAAYNVMTLPTMLVIDETGEVKHINYGVVTPKRIVRQLAAVDG